jgi:hypothetical protein
MDWIDLAQNTDKWKAPAKPIINFRVPYCVGKFLSKVRGFFCLRNATIAGFTIYYLLNCYMFRSCNHLQTEIYLLEIILLTMDPLFLEH